MKTASTALPAPQGIITDPLSRLSNHKRFHAPITQHLMTNAETRTVGRRIANCAQTLDLLIETPLKGDLYAHLMGAATCNTRLCPWCEWRRSLRWRRRIYEGLEQFAQERPKWRPLLLTLTERNCEFDELGDRLRDMLKAFHRFHRRSFFPTAFWFRKTEVTFPLRLAPKEGATQTSDESDPGFVPLGGRWAHPHIHVLLMVPPGYWGPGYVKQTRWQQEWMDAGRYDYVPVVDVRPVKARAGSGFTGNLNLLAAMEVGKYVTKASEFKELGADLPNIHWQLRGHRMIGVSQAMRQFIPDHDPQGDELTDRPVRRLDPDSCYDRATAHWEELVQEYVFAAAEEGW